MKYFAIFVAIFALASAADEKKPEEKKNDERQGLRWPLPDPHNEGDLMLHGVHYYERVGELKKQKQQSENDEDKMIGQFGRNFLRKCHKFLESTPDFKIPAVLCHDSRTSNSSRRWEIRVHANQQQDQQQQGQNVAENQDQTQQNQQQSEQQKTQNDPPRQQDSVPSKHPKNPRPDQPNNSTENVTEQSQQRPNSDASFDARRQDWHDQMGTHFTQLLLRKFRKENLSHEETEFIQQWEDDEAVHYGTMGIYCHAGENVKEIVKQLAALIDDKQ